jgi:hypothetical protein
LQNCTDLKTRNPGTDFVLRILIPVGARILSELEIAGAVTKASLPVQDNQAMSCWRLPPALAMLFRLQCAARLARLKHGFSTPRKMALSTIALLLMVTWMSNAVLSILYREPYAPDVLRHWIPIVLLAYTMWHIVKTAWRRPEEPIEWTEPEREFVCDGPFSRREQLHYRIAVILTATLLKATCASLLLLPDLRVPWAGFLGIFLGLAFVDLLRMTADVVVARLPTVHYLRYRRVVTTAAVCTACGGLYFAITLPATPPSDGLGASFHWMIRLVGGFNHLADTTAGLVVQAPFTTFATIVSAPAFSTQLIPLLLLAAGLVVAAIEAAVRLDGRLHRAALAHEQRSYDRLERLDELHPQVSVNSASLESVPNWSGIGPLAWRQLVGARKHLGGLLLALAAPGVLSCLPLLRSRDPVPTFAYVSASLGFYSLLLLPAALKFDFRRDVDKLGLFKLLPASPQSVVIGQLATPVGIACAFQVAVLCIAYLVRPVPVGYLLGAAAFLIPLNLLIFAMENTIFLMYPYRLNQEGLEVFLRTTLTFTAKSLLFSVALVVVFVLSQVAHDLSRMTLFRSVLGGNHHLAFGLTMWLSVAGGAALLTRTLSRVYDRHDVCLDRVA